MGHKSVRFSQGKMTGLWMAIGVGFGVAFGVLFDKLALGIGIGASVGAALGIGLERIVDGSLRVSTMRGGVVGIMLSLTGLLLSLVFFFFYLFLV